MRLTATKVMPIVAAMNAVDKAIKHMGSQAALASALEISQPTVSEWARGERRVPAERCPQIERLTSGAVRCEELRPDVAWDVLRMQNGEVAA
jgi:DNA-binding transcriptional regulator YdaS (Cro superfamily)